MHALLVQFRSFLQLLSSDISKSVEMFRSIFIIRRKEFVRVFVAAALLKILLNEILSNRGYCGDVFGRCFLRM